MLEPAIFYFTEERYNLLTDGKGSYVVSGWSLALQQFVAVIFKRYYYVKRNWKGLFSQILLPALFVCIAMTVALTAPNIEVRKCWKRNTEEKDREKRKECWKINCKEPLQ